MKYSSSAGVMVRLHRQTRPSLRDCVTSHPFSQFTFPPRSRTPSLVCDAQAAQGSSGPRRRDPRNVSAVPRVDRLARSRLKQVIGPPPRHFASLLRRRQTEWMAGRYWGPLLTNRPRGGCPPRPVLLLASFQPRLGHVSAPGRFRLQKEERQRRMGAEAGGA